MDAKALAKAISARARRNSRANWSTQWAIGDMILKAYGPPGPKNRISLPEVAKFLSEDGLPDLTKQYLQRLHLISYRYKPEQRVSVLPWSIHYEAGTPKMLSIIREVCRHDRAKLDRNWLRHFKREYKPALEREKQRKLEEAFHKSSESFNGKPFAVYIREAAAAAEQNTKEEDYIPENADAVISMREIQRFCLKPKEAEALLLQMDDTINNKKVPDWIVKELSEDLLRVINHATHLHTQLSQKEEKPKLQLVNTA